jgi:hypothetical protein
MPPAASSTHQGGINIRVTDEKYFEAMHRMETNQRATIDRRIKFINTCTKEEILGVFPKLCKSRTLTKNSEIYELRAVVYDNTVVKHGRSLLYLQIRISEYRARYISEYERLQFYTDPLPGAYANHTEAELLALGKYLYVTRLTEDDFASMAEIMRVIIEDDGPYSLMENAMRNSAIRLINETPTEQIARVMQYLSKDRVEFRIKPDSTDASIRYTLYRYMGGRVGQMDTTKWRVIFKFTDEEMKIEAAARSAYKLRNPTAQL